MLAPQVQKAAPTVTVPAGHIHLGTHATSLETLALVVEDWTRQLSRPHLPEEVRWARMALPFPLFQEAVENYDRLSRDERRREVETRRAETFEQEGAWSPAGYGALDLRGEARARAARRAGETARGRLYVMGEVHPAVAWFVANEQVPTAWTPDLAGYMAYLRTKLDLDAALEFYAEERQATFPEIGRQDHTLIVASTGRGKSELLKVLVHHYAAHPGAGVLILDPGRDLAEEIARWPILHQQNRLVYVDPLLTPGRTVGINPFSGGHRLSLAEKSVLAEQIGRALAEMTRELTPNMETLVQHCAMVLLDLPDATFEDLGRMVLRPAEDKKSSFGRAYVDTRRKMLLDVAWDHKNPYVAKFFRTGFDTSAYQYSRETLATRIFKIEGQETLRNTLYGAATLDLEQELNAGKFVVVNLKKYGDEDEPAAVGRLLVTKLAAMALARGRQPLGSRFRPVHLIVDEVTTMVTPRMVEILKQTRKFGVHATYAQQVAGEKFTAEERRVLLDNTLTRMVSLEDPRDGADLLNIRERDEVLPPTEKGTFWVRWNGVPGVHTVKVRSDLALRKDSAGNKLPDQDPAIWLPAPQWAAFVAQQDQAYYREAFTPAEAADALAFHAAMHPLRPAPALEEPETGTFVRTEETIDVRSLKSQIDIPKTPRGRAANGPVLVTRPERAADRPQPRQTEDQAVLKKPGLTHQPLPPRPRNEPQEPAAADTSLIAAPQSAKFGLKKPNLTTDPEPAIAAGAAKKHKLVRPKISPQRPGPARKMPSFNRGGEPD